MARAAGAMKRLNVELKQLMNAAGGEDELFIAGPTEDNALVWDCLIKGPSETPFEGGLFTAQLRFPSDYPLNPPKMVFNPPLFHPNIYANGEVCISILHAAGEDPNHYESASERWSPVQSVEKILLSVVSMLAEPNVESPASVDAAVSQALCVSDVAQKMYRTDRAGFEQRSRQFVRQQLGLA